MRQQGRWLPALFLLALLPVSAVRAQPSLATAQTVNGAVTVRRGAMLEPLSSGPHTLTFRGKIAFPAVFPSVQVLETVVTYHLTVQ